MSALPPRTWPHTCELTNEQLQRAKRIAARTGQTLEHVLAEAIKRGTSQQFSDLLAGRTPVRGSH